MARQASGNDNVGRMQFLLALRRRGISDPAVLRAMDEVPREHFVECSFVDSAYSDQALPIACGQTISQPYVVAYMTEQLRVEPGHRAVEAVLVDQVVLGGPAAEDVEGGQAHASHVTRPAPDKTCRTGPAGTPAA